MKIAYLCESCNRVQQLKSFILRCIYCGDEICVECMWDYANCKKCKIGKTEEEIIKKCAEIYES